MSTIQHYNDHLAHFYSWMAGDFDSRSADQQSFFESNKILPAGSGLAIDLGAGHGFQSVALAKLGFKVKAIDFSPQLLHELRRRKGDLEIETIEADFSTFNWQQGPPPDVVVCMGDTIAHLESMENLQSLTSQIAEALPAGGRLVYSFRDYSHALEDTARFIPVKSDDSRIHTCVLEYFDDKVRVTDLLHEREKGNWQQKVSSYLKLRLSSELVNTMIEKSGLSVVSEGVHNRMVYLIAGK